MIDFIAKVEAYTEVILQASRAYESDLPVEERIRTASVMRPRGTQSEVSLTRKALETVVDRMEPSTDVSLLYGKALKHLQMQSHKFIGDYGKLVIPFTFKKTSATRIRFRRRYENERNASPKNWRRCRTRCR